MTAALKWNLISVEDYLAGELTSPTKHEYIGGVVYAKAGGRVTHNVIKGNTFGSLFARLKGRRCRPFDSDMKIRIDLGDQVRFYYPDISVICESNPATDSFQDKPTVLIEVLSNATRRIDIGEKKDAYLTIPSLGAYILIEQDLPLVVVFRRTTSGFAREVFEGFGSVASLPEVRIELPLAEIYDGVEFTPEPDNEDS